MSVGPRKVVQAPQAAPFVPGLYAHYKGGQYAAILQAYNAQEKGLTEEDLWFVLYLSLESGQWYMRRLTEFKPPRFKLVEAFLPVQLDHLLQLKEEFYRGPR